MVFGNGDSDCLTGVAFTRNPQLVKKFFGEFLINAQGEDVVAGTRTPQYITNIKKTTQKSNRWKRLCQDFKQLTEVFIKLEKHYEICRTSNLQLKIINYGLQTRSIRTRAAIKIAMT